jgi:hypothetical protein
MNTTQDAIHKAYLQGKQAGENAADFAIQYLWGGRATYGERANAQSVIRQLEEGDPEIYDAFTLPNLSGEYGGDPTPNDIFEKCTGHEYFPDADDHQATMDEICREWEHAVADSFFATLEKSARDFLSEE